MHTEHVSHSGPSCVLEASLRQCPLTLCDMSSNQKLSPAAEWKFWTSGATGSAGVSTGDPDGGAGGAGYARLGAWIRVGARQQRSCRQGQDSNVVAIYSSIAIYIPWLFSSMGSLGWTQCYWCDYWVNNPYILDWIGHALCDLCMDWHLGQNRFAAMAEAEVALGNEWSGLPYEPTHVTRCSRLI